MRQLTILVTSISAVGHMSSCAGSLSGLLRRGHRIVFVVEEAYKGKLVPLGYEEVLYQVPKAPDEQNPGEALAKLFFQMNIFGDYSVEEKFVSLKNTLLSEQWFQEFEIMDAKIKESIDQLKPDLIWLDSTLMYPSVHRSGIPWVMNHSLEATFFQYSDEIPPGCSGFPLHFDPKRVAAFNQLRKQLTHSSEFNDLLEKMGHDRYPNDRVFPETQLLTVYACPDELNLDYIKQKDRWFNLEVFNKGQLHESVPLDQLVPKDFLADTLGGRFSGKLIYLSMGSMGSVDLSLMNRLVSILGATAHKYIVSKGPRHSEYALAPNMWGSRFLPQTSIVPHVDLVITHGGNNTTTETFAQGKPMLVMPLFADQFDNAQRLKDSGLGARVEPYSFAAKELIVSIDKLLYDDVLNRKLKAASKRILSEDRHELLAVKVEALLGGAKDDLTHVFYL